MNDDANSADPLGAEAIDAAARRASISRHRLVIVVSIVIAALIVLDITIWLLGRVRVDQALAQLSVILAAGCAVLLVVPSGARSQPRAVTPSPDGVVVPFTPEVIWMIKLAVRVLRLTMALALVAVVIAVARQSADSMTPALAVGSFVMSLLLIRVTRGNRGESPPAVLTPSALVLYASRGAPQQLRIPWDEITVVPPTDNKGWARAQVVEVRSVNDPTRVVLASASVLSLWELIVILTHFRNHPEDRDLLSGERGAELVEQLRDYPIPHTAPKPLWLRPPPIDWQPEPPSVPEAPPTARPAQTAQTDHDIRRSLARRKALLLPKILGPGTVAWIIGIPLVAQALVDDFHRPIDLIAVTALGMGVLFLPLQIALSAIAPFAAGRTRRPTLTDGGVLVRSTTPARVLWVASLVVAGSILALAAIAGAIGIARLVGGQLNALPLLAVALCFGTLAVWNSALRNQAAARMTLILRPDGVTELHRRGVYRDGTFIPWDGMQLVALAEIPRSRHFSCLGISAPGRSSAVAPTWTLTLPLWELQAVLSHFRDHPDDRAALATSYGLDIIERVRAYPTAEQNWKPSWLKPPPGPALTRRVLPQQRSAVDRSHYCAAIHRTAEVSSGTAENFQR